MRQVSVVACGRVDAGASPVWFNRSGFNSTITRSSAGVYRLTMTDGGVDATKAQYYGQLAAGGHMAVSQSSDTQVDVTITDATGTAADIDFSLKIERIP